MNVDRHIRNYGVLRNVDTGEILRLAPNFDNNIALLYNGTRTEPVKGFIEDYAAFFKAIKVQYTVPELTQETVMRAFLETEEQFSLEEMQTLNRAGEAVEFVMNSHSFLQRELCREQDRGLIL